MNQGEHEDMEDIDCEYTDSIVCPHCGRKEMDSGERRPEWGQDTCDGCGKSFTWSRNIEITYSTEKSNA